MRFNEYLKESNSFIGEIIKLIEKDCQPFLKNLKKISPIETLPMSGRKKVTPWFEGIVRKNRKPMDTPIEIQEVFDEEFYRKYKIKIRSNSLFLTTDLKVTTTYGQSYYIFPIGNYKIDWNSKIIDFFEDIVDTFSNHPNDDYSIDFQALIGEPRHFNQVRNEYRSIDSYIEHQEEKLKIIIDDYHYGEFTKKILGSSWSNEIMLNCNKYYAVSVGNPGIDEFFNWLQEKHKIKVRKWD